MHKPELNQNFAGYNQAKILSLSGFEN